MKQSETCDQSLNEKPETWPAVGERRKEPLQGHLPVEVIAVIAVRKRLTVGSGDPTFGGSERDDAAGQPNRDGMCSIIGTKLGENV
jgi:hypothetical protein